MLIMITMIYSNTFLILSYLILSHNHHHYHYIVIVGSDSAHTHYRGDSGGRSAISIGGTSVSSSSSSGSGSTSSSSSSSGSSSNNPRDMMWLYLDPQGEIQGPFTDFEMNEWYEAGYFQPSLLIKRVYQRNFVELGSLLKSSGQISPFFTPATTTTPPPLTATTTTTTDSNNSKPTADTHPPHPDRDIHEEGALIFWLVHSFDRMIDIYMHSCMHRLTNQSDEYFLY